MQKTWLTKHFKQNKNYQTTTLALIVAGLLPLMALVSRTSVASEEGKNAFTSPPYSCKLLYDAQRQCSMDSHCDKRVIERLTKECLRDGGRP